MRLLYVADGRSPIALNWIKYFVERGHEVHLVSSYPCEAELPVASLHILPLAFSRLKSKEARQGQRGWREAVIRAAFPTRLRTVMRQWLGLLTLPNLARRLATLMAQINPQIIHAMRIPFEGMVTSIALQGEARMRGIPFLVSVWGNDFTLHAPSSPGMGRYTRFTMKSATALHTDCRRDQRLARQWGFREDLPAIVLPGGGGVQLDVFYLPKGEARDAKSAFVINPRGLRAYVRNDVFFKAIPLVLERFPQTRFVCPGMAGESYAERWVHRLGISRNVELLPLVRHEQMANLFRQALIAVSPSLHDGTPNTLLEAMACGCFPVVGDLESLREWIAPRVNGLLVHPLNEHSLAEAICIALEDHELCEQAAQYNTHLIAESADYRRVMAQAEAFYRNLIG